MNRVVSSRESRLQEGPPASPLVGFDRLWVELKQREARLAACCGQQQDPTPTIFRDPSRLPKVSETMRKDPMPPPGPTPSVWLEHERRQAREQARQAKAQEGDCACQEPKAKPRRAGPDANGVRQVSGEWISRVLSLPEETRQRLVGRDIRVGQEAWQAVMAALESGPAWRRIRRDVAKRRARFWPDSARATGEEARGALDKRAQTATNGWSQSGNDLYFSCDCAQEVIHVGARYVDLHAGDDNATGTLTVSDPWDLVSDPELVVGPWKSLEKVFEWLNGLVETYGSGVCFEGAAVYLRRGQTWTGAEEGDGRVRWRNPEEDQYGEPTLFPLYDFKALEDSPLLFSAWGEGENPALDGQTGESTEPQYRDPRKGLLFYNCCYVAMSNLTLRGFGTAIGIAGASRGHVYQNLELIDNAGTGIGFGSNENYARRALRSVMNTDEATGEALAAALAALGLYPEDIVVHGCNILRNGYDTGCQGVGLAHLATNCTIYGNYIAGDSVRGVDGITGNGASSGHLIDGNTIAAHGKYCRTKRKSILPEPYTVTYPTGAVFTSAPTCPGVDYELQYRCDASGVDDSCTVTEYGYAVTELPFGTPLPEGSEAFAEDGIDLKGVRVRTPTSESTTVISGNVVYGNTGFAGISIADGSQGIHICRNRIFLNEVGVLIANGTSGAWYEPENNYTGDFCYPSLTYTHLDKTENIYVYRNVTYMNREAGVRIRSEYSQDKKTGLMMNFDIQNIFVINNTIAHNFYPGLDVGEGSHPCTGGHVDGVFIHSNLFAQNNTTSPENNSSVQVDWNDIDPGAGRFSMDHNIYIGWLESLTNLSKVIATGGQRYPLADFQVAYAVAGFETSGLQSDDIADAAFVGEADILLLASAKEYLRSTILAGYSATIRNLDHDVELDSICIGQGDPDFSWFGSTGMDGDWLSVRTDFEGVYDEHLDVGAFENTSEERIHGNSPHTPATSGLDHHHPHARGVHPA